MKKISKTSLLFKKVFSQVQEMIMNFQSDRPVLSLMNAVRAKQHFGLEMKSVLRNSLMDRFPIYPCPGFRCREAVNFLGKYISPYVFAKHGVKQKPFNDVAVSVCDVLGNLTDLNKNGTVPTAVNKELRDDACYQLRDNIQSSC